MFLVDRDVILRQTLCVNFLSMLMDYYCLTPMRDPETLPMDSGQMFSQYELKAKIFPHAC